MIEGKGKGIEAEIERYRALLRAALRSAGILVAEAERRLGVNPRQLQRILSGRRDLKLRHILAVLELVGLGQEEFFAAASRGRKGKEGGVIGLLGGMGFRGKAAPPLAEMGEEGLRRLIDEAIEDTVGRFEREGRLVRPAGPEPEDPESEAREGAPDAPPPAPKPPAGKKPH